ncbi:Acetyl esterase/lipase [Roseomonas rosea]|uniref:Acetyl esterase/lipase n=1 Tax=Muricoccus roseus TaxID=198092 RepID=A0A1M6AYI5_9PROT|nr:alpha/beta hydrolase [Roseomonas rosea]SHI41507.1 Acetyl esterase/lipase [Roseomonas rosea]
MPSLRAWMMMALIRATRMKDHARNTRRFPDKVRAIQARGPAQPGRARERRLLITRESFGGYGVFTVAPRQGATRHHILYLHGGAYVFDLLHVHWRVVDALVARTGATVTIPLYPLAPRYEARDTLGMVHPLFTALAARYGAENITVAGDSAGGGMALALAQIIRDAGEALPAGLVMFSPWLDVATDHPRLLEIEHRDPMLASPAARLAGQWYARDLPPDDPRVSPLYGSLAGLPPMIVFTGTRDMLNADARRLRETAEEAGANLLFREYDGLFHVWICLPVPEARQALDEAAAFIAAPLS